MTVGAGLAVVGLAGAVAVIFSVWVIVTNWCKVEQAKLAADRRKR